MKKLYAAIALAGVMAAPQSQAALEGMINIADSWGNGPGGAFSIDITTATSTAMQQMQGQGDPFIAFCLERNEFVNVPGTGYSVTVNNAAIKGGGGPNPDPLSKATAWLYSHLRAGDLASQAGAGAFVSGSNAAGDQFQDAVWYLEQENAAFAGGAASGKYLVDAAIAALGGTAGDYTTARNTDANGAYGVRVINLYTVNGAGTVTAYNQSMLAIVPEPSTYAAGALLLIPVLVQIRRKLRSNEV